MRQPGAEAIRDKLVAKLSRPMAIRVLRSLRASVAEAKRLGHIGHNPFEGIQIKRSRRQASKIVIPRKGELRYLLHRAQDMDHPATLALLMLLVFCGLRASELRGLAWRPLNLKAGALKVNERADARNTIGDPKSAAGYRAIPIPPRVALVLKTWKLRWPRTPQDLVFPSPKGRVMSHNYMFNNVIAPLQIAAGIFEMESSGADLVVKARYTLHFFRHTAVSLWIARGIDAKTVQTWVGHASIQEIFNTYGHLFA